MRFIASCFVVLACSVVAAPAVAQESPTTTDPKDHSAYLSLSTLHLIFSPMVEATAEFRVHEKIGVAAIAGIGSVAPEKAGPANAGTKSSRAVVWDVGGQLVTYPIGHFDHGMQLGAEVVYVGGARSGLRDAVTPFATAYGLTTGSFVGYKFTARSGFTINAQLGLQYLAMRAEASSPSSGVTDASERRLGPLVNVNLGWAF